VAFKDNQEIPGQLNAIVENYQMFQNLIVVPTMDEIVEKYLTVLKEAAR